MKTSMQAEEAALLAVDMAAAERRIRSSLDTHISELRQQIESEQRSELSEHIKLQVGLDTHSYHYCCCCCYYDYYHYCDYYKRMLGLHILSVSNLLQGLNWNFWYTPFGVADCTSSP